jgi:hypothetical protein
VAAVNHREHHPGDQRQISWAGNGQKRTMAG